MAHIMDIVARLVVFQSDKEAAGGESTGGLF